MIRRLVVAGALVALAACGPPVDNGTITAKHFEPAHTNTYMMPVSCGKNCTTLIPMTDHIPDKWAIEVEDCEHESDDPEKAHECHRAWLETTEQSYNTFAVGDYVDFRNGE